MSIADRTGDVGSKPTFAASRDQDLLKIFGTFCCKVFEYRDSVRSPMSEMAAAEGVGTDLYSADAGDVDTENPSPASSATKTPAAATAPTTSPENSAATTPAATGTAVTGTAAPDVDTMKVMKAAEVAAQDAMQHQEKFRVIHRSIALLIKSMIDDDRMAAFRRSAKEVLYAMTAIADEVFLNMDWEGKHFWEEHMLEAQFFDSQIAGEEIFERIIEVTNQKDALGTEKAEIYLNMLMLGFKGRFRGTEVENTEINMYKNKLFNFITRGNREEFLNASSRIFQKQYDYTMPTVRRNLLPDGGIVTYMATCFLIIFLGVSTMVWLVETMELSRLLNDISSIVLRKM